MSNLVHRQSKIQEKRKQTPWREFVMEIASRFPLNIYKYQGMISRYPDNHRIKNIISQTEYMALGIQVNDEEYDSSKSFFSNLGDRKERYQFPSTIHQGINENASYSLGCFGVKDCYLSFAVGDSADKILYSTISYTNVSQVVGSVKVINGSACVYESFFVNNSSFVFYSRYIFNSSDIWFSSNMLNCHHCICCNGLENKSYCIDNISYTSEEFAKKKAEILSQKYNFLHYQSAVSSQAYNLGSQNVTGNGIFYSHEVEQSYAVDYTTHARNCIFLSGSPETKPLDSFYDCMECGIMCRDFYGVCAAGGLSGLEASHVYCCSWVSACSHVFYSLDLESCSFCLGCIGLKNKSYCILNKQYTKEERYDKVDEIFGQMERDGTLGQFFPASTNPFYFNDTAAYLIDSSFTKEEVTAKGYLRRDEPIKVDIPDNAIVVTIKELDQYEGWMMDGQFLSVAESNKKQQEVEESSMPFDTSGYPLLPASASRYISPDILKCIIQDEQGNVYKIVKMEYDFLMKHGLPLPRKHRLDRMKENFRIQ